MRVLTTCYFLRLVHTVMVMKMKKKVLLHFKEILICNIL
jgi:hypothetical protein